MKIALLMQTLLVLNMQLTSDLHIGLFTLIS